MHEFHCWRDGKCKIVRARFPSSACRKAYRPDQYRRWEETTIAHHAEVIVVWDSRFCTYFAQIDND